MGGRRDRIGGMRGLPFLALASLLAFLFLVAPVAAAEEAAPAPAADEATARVVELEKAVEAHRREKDVGALGKDLTDVAAAHKATTDPKLRARLNALLGAILKGTRDESLQRDALKVVGDLGDEDNWKHVRPYVLQPDAKVAPPLITEALEAAGKLKNDDAVPHLLRLVEKSKVYPVSANAMRALGHYGGSRRHREKILEEIVTTVRRSQPGGRSMTKSDPDTGDSVGGKQGSQDSRWGVLSPVLVEAANKLTGQSASTPQDWFDLFDRYKSDLGGLFAK
jgi:hypothetical protein